MRNTKCYVVMLLCCYVFSWFWLTVFCSFSEVVDNAFTGKVDSLLISLTTFLVWSKVSGLKFQLTSREVEQPNGGIRVVPCYDLTKTECLYIATKFNDEARAKLVLRWEQLEKERNATRYTLHLLRTILSRLGIVDASITLPSLLQKVTFSNFIRLC